MTERAQRSALLVGINEYDCFPDQVGAAEDAGQLAERLSDPQATWHWGLPGGEAGTVLSGRVGAGDFRHRLDEAIQRASGGDFFFYFAGHGFALGSDDVVLADSGYDPDYNKDRNRIRLQQDILDQIKKERVKHAIILLDCAGSEVIEAIRPPTGTVLVACPGPSREHDRHFAQTLFSGLGGNYKDAPLGQAWDLSGSITALSLLTYAVNAVATKPNWNPLLVGAISDQTEIRTVDIIDPDQMRAIWPLIRSEGTDLVIDVFPDMEYDKGIDDLDYLITRLGWDAQIVSEAVQRVKTKGHSFSFRSRPPGYDLATRKEQHPRENQMECLKAMRKQKLAEVVTPDSDLFWACLNWGKVRLTEAGRDWYRHIEASKTAGA
ncbi:MAG: caspase family protein [Propionibacteriaceae bacterium]|jgi:hypothetical protein|nr:caspase family protein [Propionibacteriaceae bacterium]